MNEDLERRWFCFVCGQSFPNWKQYKAHVCTEHVQGKEWLPCPYCPSDPHPTPVRDLRSHIKVKHKNRAVPKRGQLKVEVWKSFDAQKRRISKKSRKRKFKEGFHYSTKMQRNMHYRSSWEESVYMCLDLLPEVISYRVEPFAILYALRGSTYNYIPDLLVEKSGGITEVWEIKPASQTEAEVNIAKWVAAKAYCAARGWKFLVYTEKGIRELKRQATLAKEVRQLGDKGLLRG